MLFFYPMWDSETQRIGKQKCTPLGYKLHGIAELLGFIGFMLLIAAGVYLLMYRQPFRLLALPFGVGLAGQILFWYSWRLAYRRGFRYDPAVQEARWEEDGTVRTFRIETRTATDTDAARQAGKTCRILRAGKDTLTRPRYDSGLPEEALIRTGTGTFLPGEFTDLSTARGVAAHELLRDPSALLHIVSGTTILDTLMDREQQRLLQRKARFQHAVVSTVAVCLIAACISIFALQLPSFQAHAVFAAGMALIYVILLRLCGNRNSDALLIMVIFFVFVTFLSAALPK